MEWLIAIGIPILLSGLWVGGAALWYWWDDRQHKRQCALWFELRMIEIRRRWPLPGEDQEA